MLPNCTVWLKLFDSSGFKLQSNSRAKVVWNMVAKTAEGKSRFSDRIDEYVVGLFRFLHCRCTIQTTRAWWTQCRRMPECTATYRREVVSITLIHCWLKKAIGCCESTQENAFLCCTVAKKMFQLFVPVFRDSMLRKD